MTSARAHIDHVGADVFIELPNYYRATGYAGDLSINGQLYVRCRGCSFEERASPIHLAGVTAQRLQLSPCPRCQQTFREIVRHREHVTLSCLDCGKTERVEAVPWEQVRCPNCLSTRFLESDSVIEPPLPSVFGELGERLPLILGPHENKQHPWGVDGSEDASRIQEELSSVEDEPDFHRHVLMAAMFARWLITGSGYSAETDYNMMLTVLGNLERQYFNATGELGVGLDAVGVFEDAVRVAPDDASRASSEHNVAMAINSLLIKFPEETVDEAADGRDLRQDAIDAASRALSLYEATVKADTGFGLFTGGAAVTAAQQVGRVHHLLGDLLGRGAEDDDELRVAIAEYDAAIEAGLPEVMRRAVREARAVALSNLSAPTKFELRRAAADLQDRIG